MLIALSLLACVLAAAAAVRARGLLASGMCLAGTSALLALALYLLDAAYVAVIELSVGAGLVAVLFAFSVVGGGGDSFRARPALPRWLAAILVGVPVMLLALLIVQSGPPRAVTPDHQIGFVETMWNERGLDALGQVLLLFVAAVGVKVLVGGLPSQTPQHESAERNQTEEVKA